MLNTFCLYVPFDSCFQFVPSADTVAVCFDNWFFVSWLMLLNLLLLLRLRLWPLFSLFPLSSAEFSYAVSDITLVDSDVFLSLLTFPITLGSFLLLPMTFPIRLLTFAYPLLALPIQLLTFFIPLLTNRNPRCCRRFPSRFFHFNRRCYFWLCRLLLPCSQKRRKYRNTYRNSELSPHFSFLSKHSPCSFQCPRCSYCSLMSYPFLHSCSCFRHFSLLFSWKKHRAFFWSFK